MASMHAAKAPAHRQVTATWYVPVRRVPEVVSKI